MKKNLVLVIICLGLLIPSAAMAQAKHKKPVATSSGTVALQPSIDRGKQVYAANCLTCHQADGSGVPSMNPPLIQTKWVLGNKTTLIQQVLKGSMGKVEIDGETFHNAMPSLAYLTDQQIADVLTYVRNSFGNKAGSISPAEVKSVRAKTK